MATKYHDCLVCPITFTLFSDPVVTEDGHTYERSAIIKWIQCIGTSPLTREPITIAGLRPNHTVRSLVQDFQKDLTKRDYKFKLDIDIKRSPKPFFQTTGKSLFDANWIGKPDGPLIVLLKLHGARAEKEASFYEHLTCHPNIVYTYGLVEQPQQQSNIASNTSVMLLQEKAPEGSLFDLLDYRGGNSFSDNILNQIFCQVADAMVYLSYNKIIHGDLACRNILVFRIDENEPTKTLVKLTDFGISRGNTIYSKIDAVATMIDTVPIRSTAPEILQNNAGYSEKSDMYGMGVLMWEAYSNGSVPWGELEREATIREKVIKGERLSRPIHCTLDHQWKLILKCMSQSPDDRPTFSELKKQLLSPVIISIVKEDILSPIENSNLSKLHQSNSSSSVIIKKETRKKFESPQSSIIIDETETTVPDETPSICTGGKVKNMRNMFEGRIEEEGRTSIKGQPKAGLIMKISAPAKMTVSEKTTPREELIKFTKWH